MKLFFSDYDMTIYINEVIDDGVLPAIKKWRDSGNLFIIATGRNIFSILDAVEKHNIEFDYIIANNGSIVLNNKKEILLKKIIEDNIAYDVINFLYNNYNDHVEFVNDSEIIAVKAKNNDSEPLHDVDRIINIDEIYSIKNIIQINKLSSDVSRTISIADDINKHFNTVVAYANIRYIDIVPKGINKTTGIKYIEEIIKKENKTIDRILVAGDSNNDIEMIRKYDGYVQVNAKEDIKKLSNKYFNTITEIIDKNL